MSGRTCSQPDYCSLEVALKNYAETALESPTQMSILLWKTKHRIWLLLTTSNTASLDHISMTPIRPKLTHLPLPILLLTSFILNPAAREMLSKH